jgi:hypothetical protein
MVKIFLGCHPSVDLPAKTLDLAKGNRRTFRSQTSDQKKNIYIYLDRSKSRGGNSQRREQKKKEDQRREKGRRQKMQGREKIAKSRITVFFQ